MPSTLKNVRTINRCEGLAILERHQKAHLAQEEMADSLLITGLETINKVEGLRMLEHRNTVLAEWESGSVALALGSSLKCIRTINRLDGLSKLACRKAHIAGEDLTIAFPLTGAVCAPTLKHVCMITKSAGWVMLGCCSAEDSDADSLVVAESGASNLKHMRTINKKACLEIFNHWVCTFERMSIQASFTALHEVHTSS